MLPHQAYRQPVAAALPRIDMILKMYDQLRARLEQAKGLLADQPDQARDVLHRCQVAVGTLAASMSANPDPMADNFLRLFDYVMHCLEEKTAAQIDNAVAILRTLQEGFAAIRPQALDMERNGLIPALDSERFQITA